MAAMRNWRDTFVVFLRLGLTAFGGPVAHLAYFREAFVTQRGWVSDTQYARLVALCQFLPGPASSQVAMAIGHHRAGVRGMLAAWLGFTAPSALLLLGFAWLALPYTAEGTAGWLLGIKAAVVAVVAHALVGMAHTLLRETTGYVIAGAALLVALWSEGIGGQLAIIVASACIGRFAMSGDSDAPPSEQAAGARRGRGHLGWLLAFGLLLGGLPLLATLSDTSLIAVADRFYRAGALVFGGGHVVLPLLHGEVVTPGWVTPDDFLAGYAAAQAVPGPLFSFAAYLGAVMEGGGVVMATVALVAIFLPSVLLLLGVLPLWDRLSTSRPMQMAMAGVGAGVVGLLAAAWWDPVIRSGVHGPLTGGMALVGFALLWHGRVPAWAVVLASTGIGGALL